ncbi:MAG: LD-carboxypeptidase [Candidatus Adiutrix sp.]|jgi:muramoyltetrapeptide carboxypeptidase|nr:LD-carboxypeptidase [Candidatus Adiutrix sp.]
MPPVRPGLYWSAEAAPGITWPTPPEPGQVWGLFAPAHHFDSGEFERALAVLKTWGVPIRYSEKIFRRARHLAGSDGHRLELLAELMDDPQVGGLWAVRGGFGCQRLLPLLAGRWSTWPAKPILGFSDLTALHLARLKAAGVIGWHGPMLTALGRTEASAGLDAVSRADLRTALGAPPRAGGWTVTARDVLAPGRARGPLWGGNLSLVVHLLDSPWLPDPAGAILLLEDVDEFGYRLDRLLTSLRQSRLWGALGGLVFGRFTRCGPLVRGLLREAAENFPGPVLINAPFSHGRRNRLFPLGATAVLEAG